MRARRATQGHTHKGDLSWSVSTAPLPIPARLAGSESAVSMAELPGRPSIWEEGGERVLHPEGQELRQAQRVSCSAPLPYARLGGVEEGLGAKCQVGTVRQLHRQGQPGVPDRSRHSLPGRELPIPASQALQEARGWG